MPVGWKAGRANGGAKPFRAPRKQFAASTDLGPPLDYGTSAWDVRGALVQARRFPAGSTGGGPVDVHINRLGNKRDGTIHHAEVRAAGMFTPVAPVIEFRGQGYILTGVDWPAMVFRAQ